MVALPSTQILPLAACCKHLQGLRGAKVRIMSDLALLGVVYAGIVRALKFRPFR